MASAERYKGYDQILRALPILRSQHPNVRYVLGVRTSDAVWTRLATNVPLPADGQAPLYDAQARAIAKDLGITTSYIYQLDK